MQEPRTVRELPNVTLVKTSGLMNTSTGNGLAWEPCPSPTEGTAEHPVTWRYGDWGPETAGTPTPDFAIINYTVWSDYSGSTVERSNCRSLLQDYPRTFVVLYGGPGTAGLMLPLERPADWFADDEDDGAQRWQDLLSDLAALSDYPLYDEEDHSALEQDLVEESWQSWARDDVIRELQDEYSIPEEITNDAEHIGLLFWKLLDELGDRYPECEDAVSAYFPQLDDTVRLLAERLYVEMAQAADTSKIPGQLTL